MWLLFHLASSATKIHCIPQESNGLDIFSSIYELLAVVGKISHFILKAWEKVKV
jgi:hypothetical protein